MWNLKNDTNMKTKHFITLFVAAAFSLSVCAQQSVYDNYAGVNLGGGMNTMLYQAANGSSKVGGGFEAGLFYARFFNNLVGLGAGFQYTFATSSALYNTTEVTTGLVHPSNPNMTYNLTTSFNNWREQQTIGWLSIPVEVLFRYPVVNNWLFLGGVGLSIDFPVHGAYKAKGGDYTNSGTFPDLGPYALTNMPEHGFSTYNDVQGAKINNRAKAGGSILLDAGMRYALKEHWGVYMGLYLGCGLTNLIAEAKTAPMVLINATNASQIDYAGTFDSNETKVARLFRFGVKVAVDFGWSDNR